MDSVRRHDVNDQDIQDDFLDDNEDDSQHTSDDNSSVVDETLCAHSNVERVVAAGQTVLACTQCGLVLNLLPALDLVADNNTESSTTQHNITTPYTVATILAATSTLPSDRSAVARARRFERSRRTTLLATLPVPARCLHAAWRTLLTTVIPVIAGRRSVPSTVTSNTIPKPVVWRWATRANDYYHATVVLELRKANIPVSLNDVARVANRPTTAIWRAVRIVRDCIDNLDQQPNIDSQVHLHAIQTVVDNNGINNEDDDHNHDNNDVENDNNDNGNANSSDMEKDKPHEVVYDTGFLNTRLDQIVLRILNCTVEFACNTPPTRASSRSIVAYRIFDNLRTKYPTAFPKPQPPGMREPFVSTALAHVPTTTSASLFDDLRAQCRVLIFVCKSMMLDQGKSRQALLTTCVILALEILSQSWIVSYATTRGKHVTTIGITKQNVPAVHKEQTTKDDVDRIGVGVSDDISFLSKFVNQLCAACGISVTQLLSSHELVLKSLETYFCEIRPTQTFFPTIEEENSRKSNKKRTKQSRNETSIRSSAESKDFVLSILPLILEEIKHDIETAYVVERKYLMDSKHVPVDSPMLFWHTTETMFRDVNGNEDNEESINVNNTTVSTLPTFMPPAFERASARTRDRKIRLYYAINRIILLEEGILENAGDLYADIYYPSDEDPEINLVNLGNRWYEPGLNEDDIVSISIRPLQSQNQFKDLVVAFEAPFFSIEREIPQKIVIEAFIRRDVYGQGQALPVKINRDLLDFRIEQALLDGESPSRILGSRF